MTTLTTIYQNYTTNTKEALQPSLNTEGYFVENPSQKLRRQFLREHEQANLGRLAFEKMLKDAKEKQRESTSLYGIKLLKEIYGTLKPQMLFYFENQRKAKRKAPVWVEIFEPFISSRTPEGEGTFNAEVELSNLVSFMFAQAILNKFSGRSYLTPVII